MNRVLIVEDNPKAQSEMCAALDGVVDRLLATSSAEEALQLYGEFRPNLVLVDLVLPGMSGLELIERIRGLAGNAVRVIVISGLSEPWVVARAIEAGANDFLEKPVDRNILIQLVLQRQKDAA